MSSNNQPLSIVWLKQHAVSFSETANEMYRFYTVERVEIMQLVAGRGFRGKHRRVGAVMDRRRHVRGFRAGSLFNFS